MAKPTLLIHPRDYHPLLGELYDVQQDTGVLPGRQYVVDLSAFQALVDEYTPERHEAEMAKAKAPIDAALRRQKVGCCG